MFQIDASVTQWPRWHSTKSDKELLIAQHCSASIVSLNACEFLHTWHTVISCHLILYCLSIFQQSNCPHQSIPNYLPADGPAVIFLPSCLNGKMLKDMTDSSWDEGCYGYLKTDANTNRCHIAYLQVLRSGALDRWVIIVAVHLLISTSLTLLFLIPFSFSPPHHAVGVDKLLCWVKYVCLPAGALYWTPHCCNDSDKTLKNVTKDRNDKFVFCVLKQKWLVCLYYHFLPLMPTQWPFLLFHLAFHHCVIALHLCFQHFLIGCPDRKVIFFSCQIFV